MNKDSIYKICKQHFGDAFAKNIITIKHFHGGMTNISFYLKLKDDSEYLLRIPGKGTKQLINRVKEAETYQSLKNINLNISDEVVYIDSKSGIKLSKFMHAKTCDKSDFDEVKRCITTLKKLHNANIKEGRYFNLKDEILYYERLMGKSKYANYNDVKERVFALLDMLEEMPKRLCLCHIDPNPDNFCIDEDKNIRLVDWEYAGLQDPMLDLAMFAIYSGYNEQQIKTLIQYYFNQSFETLPVEIYKKVIMYCAIAGLLWSNWCEYKTTLGIDFGDYAKRQFIYADLYSIKFFLSKMIKINNAIILAAGKGNRLQELTKDTHKALLKINNKPIIEYTIESLLSKQITNINIVVGYKMSDFEYLKEKYNTANIQFITIDDYENNNNVYSLFIALNQLHTLSGGTIILDADQIIQSNAIRKYITCSGYSTYYSNEHNDEWQPIMQNKRIIDYLVDDNTKGQYLRSLSYWTINAIQSLYICLRTEVNNKNTKIYWDEIPLRLYADEFILRTYNIKKNDIIEIDTIDDYNMAKERFK